MKALLALLLWSVAFAQTPAASPVIGMNNFIHATADLAKTTTFYMEVFGLEMPPPPRPPNPAVPGLINVPGAQLQVQVFRLPGAAFGWELTHFGGIDVKPGQARPWDPGAANLIVEVRDLDPVFAAVKKSGAPILSGAGAPVKVGPSGDVRSLVARDPDGFVFEALQVPPGISAPSRGNILGARIAIAVSEMEATLKFYRDLLGFELTGGMEFAPDRAMTDAAGAPQGAQFRAMAGTVPGTEAQILFFEAKGVPRAPFHQRVPDPGTPAIALRVADLDGLLQRLKAAGVTVVSAGGQPAQFSPTIRNIFVEDPSGFKVELYQASQ